MPFEIIRNDIVNMQVDAIVNTTNSRPVIGCGVDSGIHRAAGDRLLAARKRIGMIGAGDAAVTPGYDLPAKYVIHTVCPVWKDGSHGEAELLRRCYDRSLELARRKWCRSVAFPLMAAGNQGFPKEVALQTAVNAISAFLMDHEMMIYLVVFGDSAVEASQKLFQNVASFIDEVYVREKSLEQYGLTGHSNLEPENWETVLRDQMYDRRQSLLEAQEEERQLSWPGPAADSDWFDLEDLLEGADDSADILPERSPGSIGYEAMPMAGMGQCDAWAEADGAADWTDADEAQVWADAAPAPRYRRAPEKAAAIAPASAPVKKLEDLLRETDAGFSETLLKLIDETGKKDSEIYKKANIDRKLFSKIRKNKNYQPSKHTAVAFAIALELDLQETRDFLARAGYALSRSSKFDIIIEYCILTRNYNIHEINMILFEFDQSLLGG